MQRFISKVIGRNASGFVIDKMSKLKHSKLLVVSGPSGSGKSTLLKKLINEHPNKFGFSVSHTTRNPRPGEVNGKDYYFCKRDVMEKAIGNGEFLEHAEYSKNLYGTSKKAVKDVSDQGKICILDIDRQGVLNVKNTDMDSYYLFVKPPSMEELEFIQYICRRLVTCCSVGLPMVEAVNMSNRVRQPHLISGAIVRACRHFDSLFKLVVPEKRLRNRKTENEESLQRRLNIAKADMEYAEKPDSYDSIVVNDDLEQSYIRFKGIISKEICPLQE